MAVTSGVKLTCLVILDGGGLFGVMGIDDCGYSKFGLLRLLFKEGIEDGAFVDFFGDGLTRLRIDRTRSNLPGLRRKLFEVDLGNVLTLAVVVDFARPRGVTLVRLALDGDLDKVEIWVAECFTLATRARDACVGVMIAARKLEGRV